MCAKRYGVFTAFLTARGRRSTDVLPRRVHSPTILLWRCRFFRETRDGRHVVALNFYPRLHSQCLKFLRCSDSLDSIRNAILQWRADELEFAAAEAGLVVGMIRTTEELRRSSNTRRYSPGRRSLPSRRSPLAIPYPSLPMRRPHWKAFAPWGWGHVIAGARARQRPGSLRCRCPEHLAVERLRGRGICVGYPGWHALHPFLMTRRRIAPPRPAPGTRRCPSLPTSVQGSWPGTGARLRS